MSALDQPGGQPAQGGSMLARWWQWERTSGKFLMLSIATRLLFAGIAAVVQHYQANLQRI